MAVEFCRHSSIENNASLSGMLKPLELRGWSDQYREPPFPPQVIHHAVFIGFRLTRQQAWKIVIYDFLLIVQNLDKVFIKIRHY